MPSWLTKHAPTCIKWILGRKIIMSDKQKWKNEKSYMSCYLLPYVKIYFYVTFTEWMMSNKLLSIQSTELSHIPDIAALCEKLESTMIVLILKGWSTFHWVHLECSQPKLHRYWSSPPPTHTHRWCLLFQLHYHITVASSLQFTGVSLASIVFWKGKQSQLPNGKWIIRCNG